MNKEANELEIETYKVDGEPRIKLDINIGKSQESVIIEGEEYLKQIRTAINYILKEN